MLRLIFKLLKSGTAESEFGSEVEAIFPLV